jgi:hypothetical protein
LLDQFCLKVLPWHYHNNQTAIKGTQRISDNHDVCIPALWKKERTLIAYSREGYRDKAWTLPPDWQELRTVTLSRITLNGLEPAGEASASDGTLILSVKQGEAWSISPKE